jgi:lysozyme
MIDAVIDVSHHNGLKLDFAAAKASGTMAVIQKATQGLGNADPTYAANRAAIGAAGLLFGAYHFGDGSDGGAQAAHFLDVAQPRPGDLLALDFESNPAGPTMTLEEARAFVTVIRGKIGKWPVLYSGHDLKTALGTQPDPVLANCPLWLAQYGPAAVLPAGWTAWTLWQYTDGASGSPTPEPVPGIGHCDRDRFNGDAIDLATFWLTVSP